MPAVTKVRQDETALKKELHVDRRQMGRQRFGERLEVEDPADGVPQSPEVVRGAAHEDVARAVKAAADAFPAWSGKPRDADCEISATHRSLSRRKFQKF